MSTTAFIHAWDEPSCRIEIRQEPTRGDRPCLDVGQNHIFLTTAQVRRLLIATRDWLDWHDRMCEQLADDAKAEEVYADLQGPPVPVVGDPLPKEAETTAA